MVCSSFLKAAAALHPAPHASPIEASGSQQQSKRQEHFFDERRLKNDVTG